MTSLIFFFGLGWSVAAYSVLGGLIFAAGLEAAFGLCLGCETFSLLMRFGLIPERICEDCANWDARKSRFIAKAG